MGSEREKLDRRIADLRRRIVDSLEEGSLRELDPLIRGLKSLEELKRKWNRRRSLLLTVGAAAALLLGAGVLRLFAVRQTDVTLVTTTSSFVMENGEESTTILEGVKLQQAVLSIPKVQRSFCNDPEQATHLNCEVIHDLQLTVLGLNPSAEVRLRGWSPCFELSILRGGGRADLTFERPDVGPDDQFSRLGVGDSIRLCPESEGAFVRLPNPTAVTIGDLTNLGRAEREILPALSQGSLALDSILETVDLRQTDVLTIGSLKNSSLVARLNQPLEVTLVGKAGGLWLKSGAGSPRSIMPSQLDWVRGSAPLKTAAAIIFGLAGTLLMLRDIWLKEF